MARIAAIDYGLKRIGIALSDPSGTLAFPIATVEGGKRGVERVAAALQDKRKEIAEAIIGFPLLLSGEEGEMAQAVRSFAAELEKALGIPVILWDERLSSAQADRALKGLFLSRKERSQKIDAAAAALLLQSYLDSL